MNTTQELFSNLQDKLIIDLKENEILCPECKGLRFILKIEPNGKGFIESCKRCYTGKLTVCKHCGKASKLACDCKEANEERHNEFKIKQAQKDYEAYLKAERISYKDYNGYYLFGNDEHLKTQEDLEEWIYDQLKEGEEVPEYMWAIEGQNHFSIDLKDVISDKCEDGYEDMYDYLNTESDLLKQAQDLINKWEEEQGNNLFVYTENCKKAIIIKDLVEQIREEIMSEKSK